MPHILPDGNAVLFTVLAAEQVENRQLAVLDLKTGAYRVLVPGFGPQYSPTGHIVYGRERALLAVGFDSGKLVVIGEPVTVVEDVVAKPIGTLSFSLSEQGSLAYVPISRDARELVWVNRNGIAESLPQDSKSFRNPRLSPDGHSAAVVIDSHPWILDLRRNILEKVTREFSSVLLWSPDGKQAVVHTGDLASLSLSLISMDSDDPPEQLTFEKTFQVSTSWSPDGKLLVYVAIDPETGDDIWVLPMEGERQPRLFRGTKSDETQATVSPDGGWIAFRSNHSGQNEIYVEPFPAGGRIIQNLESRRYGARLG